MGPLSPRHHDPLWGNPRSGSPAQFEGWIGPFVSGSVVGIVLVALSLGGWFPSLQAEGAHGAPESTKYMFLPLVLINSPFGGNSRGGGLLPAYFPGSGARPGESIEYASGAPNGTVGVLFLSENVTIYALTNCQQRYDAVVQAPPPTLGPGVTSWTIPTPSNLSDIGEPTTLNLSTMFQGHPAFPDWTNGFTSANLPNITTCGGPSRTVNLTANSDYLALTIPFTIGGENLSIPLVLPFLESYSYTFPANFGTWEIQNLAIPGGPGGGWAFSYSPC